MAPMQGFVPISGKRQSWEELRKEVSVSIQPNVQNVILKQVIVIRYPFNIHTFL